MTLLSSACRSAPPPIDVNLWAADSATQSIRRVQAGQAIGCGEIQFDEYVCMTYRDFQKLYDVLNDCRDWGRARMSLEQAAVLWRREQLDFILSR